MTLLPVRGHGVRAVLSGLLLATSLAACSHGGEVRGEPAPAPQLAPEPATTTVAPTPTPTPTPAQAPADVALEQASAYPEPAEPAEPASLAEQTAPASSDLAPTQAELDFEALYGPAPTAADATSTPGQDPRDPWERYNRKAHAFNNVLDRTLARPLARAYVAVVPDPVRTGVRNFFNNLRQPVSALNALLQGKPAQAGQSLGRFVLNTTLGVGGLFDPATDAGLPYRSEDFGQTLGVWGWENSRYVELPFFGPRTVRDTIGLAGDAPLSPVRQINDDTTRISVQALQLLDLRERLMAIDSLREGAPDDYALIRDAWMQRRQYQIFGDRESESNLPDYLLEEEPPTIPADSIPVDF